MSDEIVSVEPRKIGTICPIRERQRSTSPYSLDFNIFGNSAAVAPAQATREAALGTLHDTFYLSSG